MILLGTAPTVKVPVVNACDLFCAELSLGEAGAGEPPILHFFSVLRVGLNNRVSAKRGGVFDDDVTTSSD